MRNNKLTAVLLLAATMIASCKKTTAPDQAGDSAARISKIIYENNTVSYTYNSAGNITAVITEDARGAGTYQYNYTWENGKITGCDDGYTRIIYSYPDAATIRISSKKNNVNSQYTQKIILEGTQLKEWIQQFIIGGMTLDYAKTVYSYNSSGNITTVEYFEYNNGRWEKNETIIVLQYDDKKNYSANHELAPYLINNCSILNNNPLKQEHYNSQGQLSKTITYQYSYDNSGKKTAVIKKTVLPGSPEVHEQILYTY